MKVVFVLYYTSEEKSGAKLCSNRNIDVVQNYFGKNNVEVIPFQQPIERGNFKYTLARLKNFILCRYHNESISAEKKLINFIKKSDLIFLDNSIYGILAKKLKAKNKDIKIISFFYNVESVNTLTNFQNFFILYTYMRFLHKIGKDMDKIDLPNKCKLERLSYVDDIESYMQDAAILRSII